MAARAIVYALATPAALTLATFAAPGPVRAAEVEQVYQARLLGGQYFFGGEKGALTGNASALAAPALRLGPAWTIMPAVSASYQGTKQVVDLVGAGSIFQEAMDYKGGVKAVYAPPESPWRVKPGVGYRAQLLKETKDEEWGGGLFDFQRLGPGVEVEYVYQAPFAIRGSLDYAYVFFPNYSSLESKAADGLARELAGRNVLDNHSMSAMLSADAPLAGGVLAEGTYAFQRVGYPFQRVVDQTGALAASPREDFIHTLIASARRPVELTPDVRVLPGLRLSWSALTSNQHSYDARRLTYLPRYYDYWELKAAPSAALSLGDPEAPVTAGLSMELGFRRYPSRPVQDEAGTYQGSALRQATWLVSASLAYPMAPGFSLLFNVQHGASGSNMRYEQLYAYNFSATNYLFGFVYDY